MKVSNTCDVAERYICPSSWCQIRTSKNRSRAL